MKKTILVRAALMLSMVAAVSSCSKEVLDEESEEGNSVGTGSSRLEIVTRAGDDDGVEVSYPVQVYVFNSSDKCIGVKSINDEDDAATLAQLKAGTYKVLAVGGAQADVYDLPTQDEVTETSILALKDGQKHNDLMTASSTVTMAEGETNKVTLTMERKVFLLQNVTIKQVPTTVKNVVVTLSPLRERILLDGTYGGDEGTYTVALTKQSDNTTWKKSGTEYLLPSVGNVSIKISMTRSDNSVTSFTYTANEAMVANYKMSIDGTYGGDDFELAGVLTGVAWAGEKTITFNFDANNSSAVDDNGNDDSNDNNNDNNDPTPSVESAPAAGTNYKGCLVMRSVTNDDGTKTVTLMSPQQKTGLDFSQGTTASVIESAIEELKVTGVNNWRLPTKEELKYIWDNSASVRDWLTDLGFQDVSITKYYIIKKDDTTYGGCNPKGVEQNFPLDSDNVVRLFTTIDFSN